MQRPDPLTPKCPACGRVPVDPVARPHATFCGPCWAAVSSPAPHAPAAIDRAPIDLPGAAWDRVISNYRHEQARHNHPWFEDRRRR